MNALTLEYMKVSDRLPQYGDIYQALVASEKRCRELEEENKFLNSLVSTCTRLKVENDILKNKIKEMEVKTW